MLTAWRQPLAFKAFPLYEGPPSELSLQRVARGRESLSHPVWNPMLKAWRTFCILATPSVTNYFQVNMNLCAFTPAI